MSYEIEVRREIYTVISRVDGDDLENEEKKRFIGEIVTIGKSFIDTGLAALYHIFLSDYAKFNFGGTLKALMGLRKEDALISVRLKLKMLTIFVGENMTMKHLCFTPQLMAMPNYSHLPIEIVPSLEMALEYVQRDIALHGIAPTSSAENGE